MHAVHVLTPKRFPVLTFDELLRRGHTLAVHSHEIHAGGHVAKVDAGMVLSELYGLDHLAEGVEDHSLFHFNIAVNTQFDIVVGGVRHQVDAVSQRNVVNAYTCGGEGSADKVALVVSGADSFHTYIVSAVGSQTFNVV